jgi:hypothetical protein
MQQYGEFKTNNTFIRTNHVLGVTSKPFGDSLSVDIMFENGGIMKDVLMSVEEFNTLMKMI